MPAPERRAHMNWYAYQIKAEVILPKGREDDEAMIAKARHGAALKWLLKAFGNIEPIPQPLRSHMVKWLEDRAIFNHHATTRRVGVMVMASITSMEPVFPDIYELAEACIGGDE